MLFNSPLFLFAFLPLFVLCVRLAAFSGVLQMQAVLLFFSLIFYASWDLTALPLFLGLIFWNYTLAQLIIKNLAAEQVRRRLVVIGVVGDLCPLLWYKYSGFLVDIVCTLLQVEYSWTAPPLPPGISFYTFIQIAWLVSVGRGTVVPTNLFEHTVFSSFFPYILSGPLVRAESLGPQLKNLCLPLAKTTVLGLSLFACGLMKKVLLADTLASPANAVFNAALKGWPITGAEAWLGSLAYTFQLYFDFSGYTDMAIGIGLLVGIQLPENFISPYKSTGIVDFWRRWHITLGLWLRDFLYIPLGGNRRGKLIQYRNLFLTMLIGGAWHGAGYTFVLWGALHGLMLTINHFFRATVGNSRLKPLLQSLPVRLFCIALTFFCLHLCWVLFRADSLSSALTIYTALFTMPLASVGPEGTLAGYLPHMYFTNWVDLAALVVSVVVCFGFPASHELFLQQNEGKKPWLQFRPSLAWALFLGVGSFVALLLLSRKATFLYFQF